MPAAHAAPRTLPAQIDVAVVGAGFAGMYMLHRLRGLGLSAVVFEAGDDVGGTWYWNRYPGARCDVESMQYSYSFSDALQQDWKWSERYAAQPEILRYANHVADRLDLRRDIHLATRVTAAAWDDAADLWRIETEHGQHLAARFCVMATGCLSAARLPDIAGRDSFAGPTYHTGHWPQAGVDFTGQRVAVIGTGSSAIQAIPVIAAQAAHLTVFQRTPNFSIPAYNRALEPDYEGWWKSDYPAHRARARTMRTGILYDAAGSATANDCSAMAVTAEAREAAYRAAWARGGTAFMASFNDLLTNPDSNHSAAEFVRARIRETVKDPATAERLLPRDHPIGTKRICVDTGYYETYNRPNVELVDIRAEPIQAITQTGLRTANRDFEVDALVFATGFDAMTGALLAIDIAGHHGLTLREKWSAGPRTWLGLMAAGFPNLFMVTAPGSPSVLSNMIVSIEQHVDWIARCLADLRAQGRSTIEPTETAETAWVSHVNEVAHRTLYPAAASWYMGANVPGKVRVFMPYIGGVGAYREQCDAVAAAGYPGTTAEARAAAE
jgi:cyclohexanone monooxygenase